MTDTPVLTGPDLDDLLDRLETDLEEDAMQAAGLAAQLRAQPLRADSLEAVERLQALWMQAGDAAAARAVIDNDGARVLDAAPPPEHATIRMTLALCRLAIARELRDDSALCAELETLRAIVREESALDTLAYLNLPLLHVLANDAAEHALSAIELQYELAQKAPQRAALRAGDLATRQCRV